MQVYEYLVFGVVFRGALDAVHDDDAGGSQQHQVPVLALVDERCKSWKLVVWHQNLRHSLSISWLCH